MIGLARMHAGLHHSVDVLGSVGIAGLVAGTVFIVQKYIAARVTTSKRAV